MAAHFPAIGPYVSPGSKFGPDLPHRGGAIAFLGL